MAKALRIGYEELYSRNEYCHEMKKEEFKILVMEATGKPHDSRTVERIVSTFFNANLLRGPIAHCCPLAEDEKVRLDLTVKDWFRLMV